MAWLLFAALLVALPATAQVDDCTGEMDGTLCRDMADGRDGGVRLPAASPRALTPVAASGSAPQSPRAPLRGQPPSGAPPTRGRPWPKA